MGVLLSVCFNFATPTKTSALQSDVITYSRARDGNTSLSKNFKVVEFACNDGSDEILIDPELVVILQNIRDHFGSAVTINSAYRNPAYNQSIGGASGSYHTKGMAADIVVSGHTPTEVAKYAETIGVRGVGRYETDADGYFVHVDSRAYKSYWIGQSSTATSTHGGAYNTQPYAWPVLDKGITNTSTTLQKGDNSSSVKQLQASLNSILGLSLVVDGDFGTNTENAVKSFQSQYGLTADGVAGPTTLQKINDVLNGGGSSSESTTPPTDPVGPPAEEPAKKQYTIRFDKNGGKGSMSSSNVEVGKKHNLRKNAFVREGYRFMGWAMSKERAEQGQIDYGDEIDVIDLATEDEIVTLYAVWEAETSGAGENANDSNGGGSCFSSVDLSNVTLTIMGLGAIALVIKKLAKKEN